MKIASPYTKLLLLSLLPFLSVAQTWKAHSVLSQGAWYKIAIAETGIYQLNISNMPSLQGVSCEALALYGGSARQMDEDNATVELDDLTPYAIDIYDLNGNGTMDGNDYLLFYAEGPVTWRYESAAQTYTHQRHAYANHNYLFLRTDSPSQRLVERRSLSNDTELDISTFLTCSLHEVEQYNTHNSGQVWVGEKFVNNNSRSVTVNLPYPASTLYARLALAVPEAAGQFQVSLGNSRQTFELGRTENYKHFSATFNTSSTSSPNFTFEFHTNSGATAGYLDYLEINTLVQPTWNQRMLLFHNVTGLEQSRMARHTVQTGSGSEVPRVWDVSQPEAAIELATSVSNNTLAFTASTDKRRDFLLFSPSQAIDPASVSPLPNQDLHAQESPDMVIVCHRQFLNQAQRLAMLHETMDGLNVLVATQEEVFNEFSSGKPDPVAIREMMRMFFSREETQPRYLCLFGKGTFDNRNLLQKNLPTVVTYQSPTGFTSDSYYSGSDDIFGFLHSHESGACGQGLDLGIGRLPAKNDAEALLLVDKIERYMLRVDLDMNDIRGDWRNVVGLLSDDADPSQAGDVDFVVSSEYLAQTIESQAPWINLDKIYADSYQQQSGTIGSYYPDVNNALKQRMDYGCMLLNYIGHGSDQYIGTERYMEFADIDGYRNLDRLPFFVTSTCSFGKFDKMDGLCGSEAFVLARAAGVGCVSAARPISHIKQFNTSVCANCLNPGNSIGDAIRIAKNNHPMTQNNSITLMGDPALKLSFPEHRVVVTAINGRPVVEGVDDSAQVLSRVTVEGEIQDANGMRVNGFDGVIFPVVYDRKTACRTLANDNEGTEVDFTQQKNILYKGRDTVMGGRFEYSFIVPRDVAYTYDYAKLSHYAKSSALGTDATGAYSRLMLGGFDENADISETRPEIRLFIGDTTFRNGGMADENATLLALLRDTVGINAVGSGLGHDIVAILDGNANDPIILNDFYETDLSDPSLGSIRYQFTALALGRHTLTLKAWNIYNYSSTASLEFQVAGSSTATLGEMRAYPNPASQSTCIHISHNQLNGVSEARLEIFSLMGARVRTFVVNPSEGSYCIGPVEWDLRNEKGSTVSDGIYLARWMITTSSGETLCATTKIIVKK